MQKVISEACRKFEDIEDFHDLRVVPGKTRTKIIFDIVLAAGAKTSRDDIINEMNETVKRENEQYEVAINFDNAYI